MQFGRAWLTLGFSVLVGCGGTFTREGEQAGAGGAAGTGSSSGSGGSGGTYAKEGTGNAGDSSSGAYGGAQGGYGNYGGVVGVGAYGGDISYAGKGGGCGLSTSPSGPYPVDFVFSSNTPVYIRQDCALNYDLYDCGLMPIVRSAPCVVDCNAMSNGCSTCGQCPYGALRVGPGAPLKDSWGGQIYEYGTLPSGCPCASAANATPGPYSIVVRAFLTEADALANTNPYVHTVQFELPAPNGLVAVDLGFQPI
jgi:hypothetical protein